MSLTHVCIWDSEHGFRRVTAEEARKLFPYGASARSGHFVCELCAQNVLFTKPGDNTQHFRHDPSAPNKECDERQAYFDPSYGRSIRSINSHTMPLRISIASSSFSLEIGFFCPMNQKAFCDKIRISGDSQVQYEYSFERISREGTTYLSVGSVPCENYRIEYVNATDYLKRFWAFSVEGVSRTGSFFDGSTRILLQSGGRAYVGRFYYLLQQRPLFNIITDIDVFEVSKNKAGPYFTWYLYKITVNRFSEASARFFLKYAIFLSEKPTRFYPIWPPTIKEPYFLYHNSSDLYFYLCGDDAELKTFPATAIIPSENKLYRLFTRQKEQLVSLGKAGALCFLYLVKQEMKRNAPSPSVEIIDQTGEILTEDEYSVLPKIKLVTVSCQFDGKAVVNKKGKTTYIYRISAGQHLIIDDITYGTELMIYQGVDCIRKISFQKSNPSANIALLDDELVKKLDACSGSTIPITHSFGAVVKRYAAYPQTKMWIISAIRRGKMSSKALKLITKNDPSDYGSGIK